MVSKPTASVISSGQTLICDGSSYYKGNKLPSTRDRSQHHPTQAVNRDGKRLGSGLAWGGQARHKRSLRRDNETRAGRSRHRAVGSDKQRSPCHVMTIDFINDGLERGG
jgi:hypothetical protein